MLGTVPLTVMHDDRRRERRDDDQGCNAAPYVMSTEPSFASAGLDFMAIV